MQRLLMNTMYFSDPVSRGPCRRPIQFYEQTRYGGPLFPTKKAETTLLKIDPLPKLELKIEPAPPLNLNKKKEWWE